MEDQDDELWDDDMIVNAYDRSLAKLNEKVAKLDERMTNMLIDTSGKAPNQKQNQKQIPQEKTVDDLTDLSGSLSVEVGSSLTSQIPADGLRLLEKSSVENTQAPKQCAHQWAAGDYCKAIWEEDGSPYEAVIVEIQDESTCRIRYLGYENEETKRLYELEPSGGETARQEQARMVDEELCDLSSQSEEVEFASNRAQASERSYPPVAPDAQRMRRPDGPASSFPIPPTPSSLPSAPSIDENELLTTALMSWYMSGYHTGYYQAIRDLKLSKK